jgi:hypothetical protein
MTSNVIAFPLERSKDCAPRRRRFERRKDGRIVRATHDKACALATFGGVVAGIGGQRCLSGAASFAGHDPDAQFRGRRGYPSSPIGQPT